MVKLPLDCVLVPLFVPFTTTETPASGFPFASFTMPLISRINAFTSTSVGEMSLILAAACFARMLIVISRMVYDNG
jgi:hypothetical protein